MRMHVFSKTIMQYCVIESTCVAIKKRNKFMTCNGKMWYHSDTMSEKMKKQSQQGRKKCWNNARIDHKKCGILSEKGRCDNVSICNEWSVTVEREEKKKTINYNGSQTGGENVVDEGIWKELLWENSIYFFL